MKLRIPERNWRQACGRVAQAWKKNHWVISHRLGPQGQQTQNAGWAAAATDTESPDVASNVPGPPATAAARVGPARRQRAAESEWENEGGATQTPAPAPGYSKLGA